MDSVIQLILSVLEGKYTNVVEHIIPFIENVLNI
jgi:hypothetical protein